MGVWQQGQNNGLVPVYCSCLAAQHAACRAHGAAELPRNRQHEVVIGNVQKAVQHLIGPDVGGVFATGGAEAALAPVRYQPGMTALGAGVHVAAKRRSPAAEHSPDVLEHHRTDPALVLRDELPPVRRQYRGDMVPDLQTTAEHHAPAAKHMLQWQGTTPESSHGNGPTNSPLHFTGSPVNNTFAPLHGLQRAVTKEAGITGALLAFLTCSVAIAIAKAVASRMV